MGLPAGLHRGGGEPRPVQPGELGILGGDRDHGEADQGQVQVGHLRRVLKNAHTHYTHVTTGTT